MTRKKFFQSLPRTAPQKPVHINIQPIRIPSDAAALPHPLLGLPLGLSLRPTAQPEHAQRKHNPLVAQHTQKGHGLALQAPSHANAQELQQELRGAQELHGALLLADLPFAGDLTLARLDEAKAPDRPQDLSDEPYVRPPPA
jgi:hypothetical protein